jgi:hypothetical protein
MTVRPSGETQSLTGPGSGLHQAGVCRARVPVEPSEDGRRLLAVEAHPLEDHGGWNTQP